MIFSIVSSAIDPSSDQTQEDMEELAREPYSKPSGFMSSSKDVENLGSARACE